LSQAFRIETLDRSGRWYLTPGARSIYDLRIRNDSKNAVECSLVVDEPAIGVSVNPAVFSLGGLEVRTVTVTFAADVTAGRAQSARLTLRADDGSVLFTFEHPLVVTGGTDCSIAMAYKNVIVEAGELRGFEVACSVRSQSEATSTFQVSLSEHPALSVPELPPISLEPGQLGEMVIPIQWNRSVKDEGGWNHPVIIEAAVPVSNGRRTSRMRWESIELQLEPFLKNGAQKMNVTVSTGGQTQAAPPVDVSPATPSAPPPAPAIENAAAMQPTMQPANEKPSAIEEQPATALQAEIRTADSAPAVNQAAASTNLNNVIAQRVSAPATLMLNGHTQLLMLAAPVDVKEAASSAAATSAAAARAADAVVTAHAPPQSASETIELPLFADLGSAKPPSSPVNNGKPEIAAKPVAQPPATRAVPASAPAAETAAPTLAKPAPAAAQPVATSAKPSTEASTAPTPAPAATETKASAATGASPSQTSQPKPAVTWTIKTGAEEATVKQPTAKPAAASTESTSQVAAASASTPPASQHTPTSPAPAVPQSKLTPYAPVRWNAESEAPGRAPDISQPAAPPAPVVVVPPQLRTRPIPAAPAQKVGPKLPAGLVIGGLAGGALLVAGLLIFKPTVTAPPSSKPVAVPAAVITPVVRAQQPRIAHRTLHNAKAIVAAATQRPAATPAPAPTVRAATPRPASTPAPATPKPAAQRVVAARPASKPVSHYARLYQPETGPVVALGSVEAYYGPRGHAVRVLWGAAEQASAVIQLIDEHGSTVSATSVHGGRSSALLYLPRGFRGPLTVQVSSIGRMGERVATTTALPAFGQ